MCTLEGRSILKVSNTLLKSAVLFAFAAVCRNETVKANKNCLSETYSTVREGKHLSDMLPIRNGLKQGDVLSPLLFKFALEYAIRGVQVNQDSLKLNGAHQFVVYTDDVNILGLSLRKIDKNPEALVVASKEIGLEVNADKTKYMVMSRDYIAGRIHNIKIDNRIL